MDVRGHGSEVWCRWKSGGQRRKIRKRRHAWTSWKSEISPVCGFRCCRASLNRLLFFSEAVRAGKRFFPDAVLLRVVAGLWSQNPYAAGVQAARQDFCEYFVEPPDIVWECRSSWIKYEVPFGKIGPAMELEGRLNPAMSLPEVLQFLSMGKMTGTLTVSHGNYSAMLVIRQGRLINSSNLNRPRRLGQMLINRGLLPRRAVEDAVAFQKHNAPQTPLGQILIQRGNVTTEQVRQALRLQLEEEMWDLFGIQEGSFKFEHGDERAVSGDSLVELDIDPLLIEGTRRLDEWARIEKNIPLGESAVPAVNPDEEHLDRDAMTFSDNEWRVLSLINGFYDIGSIASRSGIGKFETFRVINSFLASGHIIIDEEASAQNATQMMAGSLSGPGFLATQNALSHAGEDLDEELDLSHAEPRPGVGAAQSNGGASHSSGSSAAAVVHVADQLRFTSPVGFLASLANAYIDELLSTADFAVGPEDEALAEKYWRTTLMVYPKADLVQARGRALDAASFERFVNFAGMEGALRPVFEDTVEALGRYLKTIYLLAAQRLGIKTAQVVTARIFEELRSRSAIANSENFYFQDFAGKIYS